MKAGDLVKVTARYHWYWGLTGVLLQIRSGEHEFPYLVHFPEQAGLVFCGLRGNEIAQVPG